MYKYILEPYKGRSSRFTCPNCGTKHSFVRYIDTETGDYIGDDIGRCNREQYCAYHKSPSSNGLAISPLPVFKEALTPTPLRYYPNEIRYRDNLFRFLEKKFTFSVTKTVFDTYMIVGDDKKWENATVFYQIDRNGVYWSGKIMLYDENTGKRIKKPYPHVNWVHSIYKDDSYVMEQHLFGEHLIGDNTMMQYVLVESEKTCIVCSILEPKYIWIATGGLSNLNERKLKVLEDKNVMAIPDVGGYDIWKKKLEPLGIAVLDILENKGYEEGSDIADICAFKVERKRKCFCHFS